MCTGLLFDAAECHLCYQNTMYIDLSIFIIFTGPAAEDE